jgi:hypothetical protein
MSLVHFTLDTVNKELVIRGPIPVDELIHLMSFGKKVFGKNSVCDGKRAEELGAAMVIRSGDKC